MRAKPRNSKIEQANSVIECEQTELQTAFHCSEQKNSWLCSAWNLLHVLHGCHQVREEDSTCCITSCFSAASAGVSPWGGGSGKAAGDYMYSRLFAALCALLPALFSLLRGLALMTSKLTRIRVRACLPKRPSGSSSTLRLLAAWCGLMSPLLSPRFSASLAS